MENTTRQRESLSKTLKRGDIWAFAFGSIVGWGWVMLAGGWVISAGTVGAIIAFIIAAVLCGFVGMAYAELTPALPLAGGSMVWCYRASGYKFAWFSGWAIAFAYVAVAAWEGPAFASAVAYLIPLPEVGFLWNIAGFDVYVPFIIVSMAGTIFTMFCHYRGLKFAAIFNTIAAIALVAGGVIFFLGGVTLGDIANAAPAIRDGFGGISIVLVAAPAMFVGFDVIPQASEEMDYPIRQVGILVLFAIFLGVLWYIMMIVGTAFTAPADFLESASIPLADAASYVFNSKIFGTFIIIAGIGGILTSWNAMFVGSTRILFSMSRAKMLPTVFSKLHPKYGSPTAAITLVGVLGLISPLLGKNALGWFVDASSFGTVVAYLTVSISFVMLRKKEPDLKRPWKAPGGYFTGFMAIVSCLFFIVLYLPIGPGALEWPYEWGMVLLWVIIGIILVIVNKIQFGTVTEAERELLLFGEEYARPEKLK